MNKGKQFEELVTLIEKAVHPMQGVKVLHDVKLPAKYGRDRQIDVLILDERDGRFVFKTIIECKNKVEKVDLNTVGAFKELLDSVNAHQGIIVSAAGFQAGALESAKERNILLYELSKPKEVLDFFQDKKFGYHELQHKSKDVTIRFKHKKEINREIDFYTDLFSPALERNVKLVDVVDEFLKTKYQSIFDRMFKQASSFTTAQNIVEEIEVTIDFPIALIYSSKGDTTEINSFSVDLETELFLAPTEAKNLLAYRNVNNPKPYAYVYELSYEGVSFHWVEKTV